MLKPYVCVACEKVILSQPDSVPSLIALFRKMIMTVPEEAPEIPKNAVAPQNWAIYSAWDPEPGDEQRNYFLCTQLLYPDQTQFGEIHKNRLNIEVNKQSQFSLTMLGFPIGQPGFYTVRVWLEEKDERVFGPLEFKIELEIIRQKHATSPN